MRLASACLVVLACLLSAPTAQADDSAAARHFDAGVRLYDGNPPDYEGALAEFEAAYREKPSPLLRLNLALCLRALRRYPDAARELRTMLAEVAGSVPVETKRAAERALRELDALVARVVVRAIAPGSGTVPSGLELLVDGRVQDAWDGREPVDVGAGEHQFEVRAPGFDPAISPLIRTSAGETKTVELELVLQEQRRGRLVIDTDLAAIVRVDGGPPSPGGFDAEVSAGSHEIEVRLPSGRVLRDRVVVSPGEDNDFTAHEGDSNSGGVTRVSHFTIDRPWLVEVGVGVEWTSLRILPSFGGDAGGDRLGFVGAAVSVRGGRRLTTHFGVMLAAEFAELRAQRAPLLDVTLDDWTAALLVRYATEGRFGVVASGGPGVVGRTAESRNALAPTSVRTASGFGAMFYGEVGACVRLTPVEISLGLYGDVRGVSGTRTEDDGSRIFADTPAFRLGGRLGVGVVF